ncbi:MAG: hypothetical protein Q9159_005386 [Coniocarpon cinnabarinum]
MADVAIGGLGLLGLFSSAVDAVQLIHAVVDKDPTLKALHTQLENQRARFLAWGANKDNIDMIESYGGYLRLAAWKTVGTIKDNFDRLKKLERRYDFAPEVQSPEATELGIIIPGQGQEDKAGTQGQPHAKHKPVVQWSPRIHAKNFLREPRLAILWVTGDADRLSHSVTLLRGLIDDLYHLSRLASDEGNHHTPLTEKIATATIIVARDEKVHGPYQTTSPQAPKRPLPGPRWPSGMVLDGLSHLRAQNYCPDLSTIRLHSSTTQGHGNINGSKTTFLESSSSVVVVAAGDEWKTFLRSSSSAQEPEQGAEEEFKVLSRADEFKNPYSENSGNLKEEFKNPYFEDSNYFAHDLYRYSPIRAQFSHARCSEGGSW